MCKSQSISLVSAFCTQTLGWVLLLCLLAGTIVPNLAESVDSQFISCEYKKALETEEKEKEAQDEKEDTEKEGEELFIQLDVATNWIPNSGLIAPEHQFTLIGTDSEVLTPPPQYV